MRTKGDMRAIVKIPVTKLMVWSTSSGSLKFGVTPGGGMAPPAAKDIAGIMVIDQE
jgi:hypothetical protein